MTVLLHIEKCSMAYNNIPYLYKINKKLKSHLNFLSKTVMLKTQMQYKKQKPDFVITMEWSYLSFFFFLCVVSNSPLLMLPVESCTRHEITEILLSTEC